MMARLVIADAADTDTQDIMEDLAEKAGAGVADQYDAKFDAVYRRLETFPESGARRPKLGPLARICVILPYIIIYEYSQPDDLVIIMRILHGRRSINRRSLRIRA